MVSPNMNQEKACVLVRVWEQIRDFPKVLMKKVLCICRLSKEIAQDDPRKVIHSLKVGLAISLVSLFYYYQPLYENFGLSAMWAVMTVVVVFEYTVGATLGKGLNRTMATLAAGALGVGAHYLASLSGETGEPILIGFFVFLQAAIASFIRFFPKVKSRYDYGMLIFILTFSLISVSGFRDDEVLKMAHKRLSTIFLGGSACVMISIFVCPVWAGEELHDSIAIKLEILGDFLEAFVGEYFKTTKEEESKDKKSFLEGYKSILNSKSNDESLANFARWEPGHGKFKFRHPWNQYLKIGALSRQCAYRMEALKEQLNSDTKGSHEIRSTIQELCTEMCLESSMALKQLSSSIKTMTRNSSPETHVANAKAAVKSLNSLLQSSLWKEADLLSVIPAVTVASLLIDIVDCTEEIADSANVLASIINFVVDETNEKLPKEVSQSPTCECAEPDPKIENSHVVIIVDDSKCNKCNKI
ncbi:putative aluminum-activated malate transporter [Medicago truncatula]|uniref:Aluminum activated malate transporter family protein n=1 Tax=Medicago truncatula TaxID=3880 RepID=A0A072UL02_MEDTR|nr:aluminum-activated malate transporter 2 isoform X1 [Medicago truncatula]KEH29773.1 aluminum activated malate transporter family protein [Medicago truncatula]RHN60415.1 putative aluminum-activated malate transporter [Medicago truncatula]